MRAKGKKPQKRMDHWRGGEGDEPHLINNRLSEAEREAVQQGIDAVEVGSFAPDEEMEEFYRLHCGA